MAKKILLIENDAPVAGEVSRSLEGAGFDVRVTGDGKEGFDQAREWSPDAVVLCVELPGMSGYLVCQKLRKDEATKGIPLVLTSAEATEETFEKHRTLKARADEYLLKPYAPEALLALLDRLVGLPEATEPADEEIIAGDEELVTLEEEAGLEAAEGEPDRELPGLDLQSLPEDMGSPASSGEDDEDLRLLDDAFDGLAAPPAAEDAAAALDELEVERPVPGEDVDAAAASLPEDDEGPARDDLESLDDAADEVLGALDEIEGHPSPDPDPDGPRSRPVRGASADVLRASGVTLLDGAITRSVPRPASPERGGAGSEEAERLERALADAREALRRAQADLESREQELSEIRSSSDAIRRRAEEEAAEAERARGEAAEAAARASQAEADAREARRAADEARAAEAELAETQRKLAEAERRATEAEGEASRRASEAAAATEAMAKAESLEREVEELRTELLVARGEAEGARSEVEKRTADLRGRLDEAEAQSQKNEERVVKAYQKIKADEKVREKVRKALAIAMQLLDDGLAESSAEKERRAAGLVRE